MNKLTTSILATLALILAGGCSQDSSSDNGGSDNSSVDKEPVKIAILHHILSTPFVAALIPDKEGMTCFDKSGIEPLINKRSKGPEVVDALLSGSVEFGTLAITPQIFQILQGEQLSIFSTYQTSNLDIKFVGRISAGITSPKDIKGKRIGYVGGTYGEIFLERYLEKHNIAKKDVILTSGAPAFLRDLFINKSLDGAILWEPVVQDIMLDTAVPNNDLFIDVDKSIYTARVNLLGLADTLKKDETKAKKLVEALICAEFYLEKQPDIVQERLEKWLGRSIGSLNGVFHPETFRVTLDVDSLKSDLASEAKWANSAVFSGKADIPSDFSPYVNTSIMNKVDASRVNE